MSKSFIIYISLTDIIFKVVFCCLFCRKLHWQLQGEDGLLKRCGGRGDGAAVQGDYLTADAEANA